MNPRHLLLSKYAILNASAAGLVGAAYAHGYLDSIIATDSTHMCALIAGLAVAGVALAGRKAVWLGREIEAAPGSKAAEFRDRDTYRLQLQQRLSWIRYLASLLVVLGLVGTVVGMIQALSGVDASVAGDVQAAGRMVAALVAGLSTALYTTLVGSVGNIALMLNYRLLENAAAAALVAVGKR
jgi:hypothetical protein